MDDVPKATSRQLEAPDHIEWFDLLWLKLRT